MLSARSVALNGIGFSTRAIAVFGFSQATGSAKSWAEENARSHGKKRLLSDRGPTDAEIMRESIRLARQIEEEDEIVLAVVMSAAPLLGASRWQLH